MCVIYVQTASICNQSQLSKSIRSKMTNWQRWKGRKRFFEVEWLLLDICLELIFFGNQRYDFAIMGLILLKIAFNELYKAIFGFYFAFLVEKPYRFFVFHLACKTLYFSANLHEKDAHSALTLNSSNNSLSLRYVVILFFACFASSISRSLVSNDIQ